VIDVGGGSSALAEELLRKGFPRVTVLDLSSIAIANAQARMGVAAQRVNWIQADVTTAPPLETYDLWHDRAVFHFLTTPDEIQSYVGSASRSVHLGGHAVIATFGLEGPTHCSGLPVKRYGAEDLAKAFEGFFRLSRSQHVQHTTPAGAIQPFLYILLERA
jgi:2-polyprenyl-3-methyl-5-hydroxy-6-metoxy-1,4-benzoquinol methylase